MKTHTHIVLAILATLVFTPPAPAQTEEIIELSEDSPVRQIRPVGEDGGTFYVVYCKNNRQGGVEVYTKPKREFCAGPPRQCRPSWSVVAAAEHVCR